MTNFNQQNNFSGKFFGFLKLIICLVILSTVVNVLIREKKTEIKNAGKQIILSIYPNPPLVMEGGNPYIRALMRTISFSESNYVNPYNVIYTGKYVEDLSRHPNICITIVNGPNKGKCSTAAGRYQFLNTTWEEKASKYHPQKSRMPKVSLRKDYSFEPLYQDKVVYNWLSDESAWGKDISQLLKNGEIDLVLRLLSPTWTSLGYGIEDNNLTRFLPLVYQKLLKEELG